jgi:tetratricopeptide (TPR) repeat protein
MNQQILAATWLLRAGRDAVTVAPYQTRAMQLFDTQTPKPQGDLSIVLLAPAHIAWRVRDAGATTTELTRVASNPRVDATLANAVFGRVAGLYLAMGQVGSARVAIGRMGPADNSEGFLATADYYAGDSSSEPQHLDRVCKPHDGPQKGTSQFPACMMLLIRRGRLDDAEALLKRAEAADWDAKSPPVRAALGALAVAQHRPDDAIKILSGMTDPIDRNPQYYRVMRALSDAWLQKQNRETAINTLRLALNQRTYSLDPSASLEATALAFRLAALYRSAGATNEAAAVEKDAMRGLERADPGFVDRLKALGAEGLGR